MPTKRKKLVAARVGLSPAAVAAWQQGDFSALFNALDSRPWKPSPWPLSHTALGVDQSPTPPLDTAGRPVWHKQDWAEAQALQRLLFEIAGEPGGMARHGVPLGPGVPCEENCA